MRRFRIISLVAAGALALASLPGCTASSEEDAAAADGAGPELAYQPSAAARAAIAPDRLESYRLLGAELGLDWTIIAAVSALESDHGRLLPGGGPEEPDAIGFTLLSTGAPERYRLALRVRGGPGFAERALALADTYRGGVDSSLSPPPESGRLARPVSGAIRARFGPLLGRFHDGIDFDAREETEVAAAAAGAVSVVASSPAYGNYLCLLHRFPEGIQGQETISSCYGYLGEATVDPGQVVERGEAIGRSGCSGACLSPRVHFIVRLGGREDSEPVDPAPFLGES